jgi:hypothetical protein
MATALAVEAQHRTRRSSALIEAYQRAGRVPPEDMDPRQTDVRLLNLALLAVVLLGLSLGNPVAAALAHGL